MKKGKISITYNMCILKCAAPKLFQNMSKNNNVSNIFLVTEMDLKMIFIVGLVILGLSSTIEAKPTCAEPTCGGTREVAGAPPAEGEGEEGEEEKADPCSEDPYSSWRNFLAWSKFCEDGTVGYFDPEMPPGKIGQPAEEGEEE